MPKRARETEEAQDSTWIGRAVMLTPAAARGKRLPEAIVIKSLRVARGHISVKEHEYECLDYKDCPIS